MQDFTIFLTLNIFHADEHQHEKMENYAEKDISPGTINALNDDCLRLIFQYLPIVERIKIERGKLSQSN